MAAQMQKMRNQLEQLQAEVLYCRGGGALEELQVQAFNHTGFSDEAINSDFGLISLFFLFEPRFCAIRSPCLKPAIQSSIKSLKNNKSLAST